MRAAQGWHADALDLIVPIMDHALHKVSATNPCPCSFMITYALPDAAALLQGSYQSVGIVRLSDHSAWFANPGFVRATQALQLTTGQNPLSSLPALQQCMLQCVAAHGLVAYEHAASHQRWECLPVQLQQPDGSLQPGVQCTVLPMAAQTLVAATAQSHTTASDDSPSQRILDSSPHHHWACSLSGEVFWTNRTSNLFTYGQPHVPDLDNTRYIQKIHPDDLQLTGQLFSKAMAEGVLEAPFRYRLRNHMGIYHWFRFNAAPVRNAAGEILHWAGTSINIDEIVAGEAALQAQIQPLHAQRERLQAQLRESQTLLGSMHQMDLVSHLAGGVAHDLNNLLFVSNIHLAALQKRLTDPGLLERLQAMRECSRKAARLSTQLSGFSGRLPQNAAPLHTTQLMGDLYDLLRQAAGAETDFRLQVDTNSHNIHADRIYLENALLNLVINARDATDGRGQVQLEVRNHCCAGTEPPEDYVAFCVRDNGQGMPPEVQARIFEPFFTTKAQAKGTGLGLPMVKNFVDNSQGFIQVESTPGQGSALTLYLPVATDMVAPPVLAEEPALPPGQETVLLIEDDPSVSQAVASVLCELGYELITANDPTQAIALLGGGVQVDIIVSDVKMPGQKNILDLIAYVESSRPVPIIFNTGYSADIAIQEGLIAQQYPVLFKPFPITELTAKLRELLGAGAPQVSAQVP